jgi:hypothetical protein
MTDQQHSNAGTGDASLGALVSQMSEQTSKLVRDEVRLAQAELAAKGKSAGIGVGLFGGAGVFTVFGVGALVAAAILGLAQAVDGWLAALIVGAALIAIAGIAALAGKKEVTAAVPPAPTEAVDGLKQDVATIKSGSHA